MQISIIVPQSSNPAPVNERGNSAYVQQKNRCTTIAIEVLTTLGAILGGAVAMMAYYSFLPYVNLMIGGSIALGFALAILGIKSALRYFEVQEPLYKRVERLKSESLACLKEWRELCHLHQRLSLIVSQPFEWAPRNLFENTSAWSPQT